MSSNIEIIKRCAWCGKEFVARKTSTEYCSHRCSGLAYKERKRQEKFEAFKSEYAKITDEVVDIEKLEFLSPTQLCQLLGISRATVYRYFADNAIIAKIKNPSARTSIASDKLDKPLIGSSSKDSLILRFFLSIILTFYLKSLILLQQ